LHSFTVEKAGVLKWKARIWDSLLPPKILVNDVEVQGLDSIGECKVVVGDAVMIIDMIVFFMAVRLAKPPSES
jgi:ATP-dependent exoDNAse (exonuclease V) alpha subunit